LARVVTVITASQRCRRRKPLLLRPPIPSCVPSTAAAGESAALPSQAPFAMMPRCTARSVVC